MTNPTSYSVPYGASIKRIPQAAIAPAKTSKDLVSDHESDAFYFRSLENSGIALNARQIEAVRHDQGPLLTLAGAGSGKTSVLVARAGYLMNVLGVHPSHILLVTFSSKAAAEMKQRIAALPGITSGMAREVQARTFHSFFLLLLRRQGYTQDIFSETRYQHIVLKRILRERGLQDDYEPETLLSVLSSCKMNMTDLNGLPERSMDERNIKRILRQYEQWKADQRKMDFDDILVFAHKLLLSEPSLLASLQQRFRYVMNDEFQDTNKLQYELVRMIAEPQNNLMVVGDDDQTIYTFQGASHEFILQFHRQYPKARTVTLDINYRSTSSIVGLGNEIIRHNMRRKQKTLQATKESPAVPRYYRPGDTDDEAATVLAEIRSEVEQGRRSYSDYAVLYRTASSSRAMLEELVIQNIPFVHDGNTDLFYEQWIVKPIIDHLRLAMDRRSFAAIEGILQTLYVSREKGMEFIYAQEKLRPKKGPLVHLLSLPDLKEFQKEKVKERIELVSMIRDMKPADAIRHMRRSFYDVFMETADGRSFTQHKEMLKETLDELESSAKRFDSIEAFLGHIGHMLQMHQAMEQLRSDPNADTVSLMTIHKAKGLEFPVVFVIGFSEGILPHSSALDAGEDSSAKGDKRPKTVVQADNGQKDAYAALEEERRLAYVAVTRAKEELIVCSPAYYRGKKANVSRFLTAVFSAPKPAAAANTAAPRVQAGPGPAAAAAKPGGAGYRSAPGSGTGGIGGSATASGAPKKLHTVPAWLCTSGSCPAWARISSAQESKRASKACPLCQAPMRRGSKEVPV
ncbi:UvrD-helicase domain-containing protein [Paenibacillus doosanensis]|uniref:UvrD-helicase domain-containing protein n=1 Tax=Paenibacillus doosanensis TaxID=1229154 RepID=UPI0021805CC8|nr:UvrD-helicase domain-containing protein [Paenibacillus doosanensis]MCS7459106.1 UvrD-helicase domain-containing protein [Paenibacillus doosanensis]